MTKIECELFSKRLDVIQGILRKALPGDDNSITKLVSLYMSLPMSVERIQRAKWERERAKRDLFSVLDLISEQIGTLGKKLAEVDFKQVCDSSSKINLQMSRIAKELEKGEQ